MVSMALCALTALGGAGGATAAGGTGNISGMIQVLVGDVPQPCSNPVLYVTPDEGSPFFFDGNPDGTYLIENLPVGKYVLAHACFDGNDWILETWDNHPGFDSDRANKVRVLDNVTTSQINSVLEPGGGISGMVTKKNGKPWANPCDALTWAQYANGVAATFAACADVAGAYRIGGTPAKNRVYFFGSLGGYQSEFYKNKPDVASANVVKTPAGTTTSGIDATLAKLPPPTSNGRPVVPPRAPNA
jgi:hypothetical protein